MSPCSIHNKKVIILYILAEILAEREYVSSINFELEFIYSDYLTVIRFRLLMHGKLSLNDICLTASVPLPRFTITLFNSIAILIFPRN